jgi:hypothetical protein
MERTLGGPYEGKTRFALDSAIPDWLSGTVRARPTPSWKTHTRPLVGVMFTLRIDFAPHLGQIWVPVSFLVCFVLFRKMWTSPPQSAPGRRAPTVASLDALPGKLKPLAVVAQLSDFWDSHDFFLALLNQIRCF